jgi:hypothetical protein
MVKKDIEIASESYHKAAKNCRDVFAAGGRQFVEPQGLSDHIRKARDLYGAGDEAGAVKEVETAERWLKGIATKLLRGATDFFEGRIKELSYMSLDPDIMENLEARLRDFCAALMLEQDDSFELRAEAYRELAKAVSGARDEQFARNEERERLAHEEVQRQEEERRQRRAEAERQKAEEAAAARATREKQFDELFA